jgi:MFS transporter, ACS family, glucarate transporter
MARFSAHISLHGSHYGEIMRDSQAVINITVPSRTRWLIVALLFGIYMIMVVDRVSISIAAKYIMPEYQLSEVQIGWIFSAFLVGYALFQIPGGWLGDRFGPRRVLTFAVVWWSVFTVVTAVAGDLFLTSLLGVVGSFIVVRVLFSLGEGAGVPNYNRAVTNWVARQERGLALGLVLSGNSLGLAVTPPLVAWIMVTWGWRAAFYLAGGVGLVAALGWYWLATDQPEEHPWVNAAELQYIAPPASASLRSQTLGPVPWRAMLGRRTDLWFLTAATFIGGYVLYVYVSWFYLYLVNVRGFSVLGGGLYSAGPFLVGTVVAPLGGWLSDHFSRRLGKRVGRCGIGCSGLLLSGGAIFIGAGATDPYVAVLFLSLGGGALFFSSSAIFATAIDLAGAYAGTVTGFVNMGIHLGAAIAPTLTPILAHRFGWESALYVAAALAWLGALFWLGVHPERAIDLEEEAAVLPQKKVFTA